MGVNKETCADIYKYWRQQRKYTQILINLIMPFREVMNYEKKRLINKRLIKIFN